MTEATPVADGRATSATAAPGAGELRDRLARVAEAWPRDGADLDPDLVAEARSAVAGLVSALEAGIVRAASPDPGAPDGWRVDGWVKSGILLGFRLPGLTDYRDGPILSARDRSAFGLLDVLEAPGARQAAELGRPWRIVPGGTTIRSGVHLEPGVTVMPPAYANAGAWVGQGSMIDSHVLVGSCAQVGGDVHLGAGVQVGGVLEPPGARPVIVEDGAFVGGGCGLYEGVIVGRGAVLGAGVILAGQGRLIDLVESREIRGTPGSPLVVPPGSVVVPGTRPASGDYARQHGIGLAVPVIVKRRDEGTDARVALEDALR